MSTTTRVYIQLGVNDVQYQTNESAKNLQPQLEAFFAEELPKWGIIIFSKKKANYKLDPIQDGDQFGWAFGIDKTQFTHDLASGEFRYKTKELHAVLRKAVRKYQLSPKIRYTRGAGVFVYNLFLN